MRSPNQAPLLKTGSNLTPRPKETIEDERFYSPQNTICQTLRPTLFHSDKKKTTGSQTENEENVGASNNSFIFLSEEESLEEPAERAEYFNALEAKKKSQHSEDCHGRLSRVKNFELTGLEYQNVGEERKQTKINCECDFQQLSLIQKKSWKSIQVEDDAKVLKGGKWTKTRCMLTKDRLAFIQIFFEIKDISKIKIFQLNKETYQQVLKVQVENTAHFFSLDNRKKVHDLPLPYFVFARLVIKKIEELDIGQLEPWHKTNHVNKNFTQDSYMVGKILKKSQHFGAWSQRYVVIKQEGIYSYRDETKEDSHSYFIEKPSIKYIWTRLEITSKFLIIKIKHGITKTQFGIPINNFSCRSCRNWLLGFCRMLT